MAGRRSLAVEHVLSKPKLLGAKSLRKNKKARGGTTLGLYRARDRAPTSGAAELHLHPLSPSGDEVSLHSYGCEEDLLFRPC